MTSDHKSTRAEIFSHGPRVRAWIEQYCVYPQGPHIGEPFVFLPWQVEWVNELFRSDAEGNLAYRWALLGIPKKNGKTTLAAALGLYHLLGDEDEVDPWVVCGATSKDQADLAWGAAAAMCKITEKQGAPLGRAVKVWNSGIIEPLKGYGRMEKIASAKGHNDGKNISLAILDELHEWDETNWTIITNGTVGRERSQIVQITTAGYDLDTVCGREVEKGRAIERGDVVNPTYFYKWYGAPAKADFQDPAVWADANPSYGDLITEAALRDKMLNNPESQFRRYFLNQWVKAETSWFKSGVWESGYPADGSDEADFVPGAPTWVGWDASTKRDTTAVVKVQLVSKDEPETVDDISFEAIMAAAALNEDEADEPHLALTLFNAKLETFLAGSDQKLRASARVWGRPRRPDGRPDLDWVLPIGEVEAYIRELCTEYDVQEVSYDPMFITWSAISLEQQGMPLVEFWQTDSRMCPATQTVFELVNRELLIHEPDDTFDAHIESTAIANARNGGQRVAKGKERNPQDASVALCMAAYRAVKSLLDVDEGPRFPSLWVPEA